MSSLKSFRFLKTIRGMIQIVFFIIYILEICEAELINNGQCEVLAHGGYQLQLQGPLVKNDFEVVKDLDLEACSNQCCRNATCDVALHVVDGSEKTCVLVNCPIKTFDIGPCAPLTANDTNVDLIVRNKISTLVYIISRNTTVDVNTPKPSLEHHDFNHNEATVEPLFTILPTHFTTLPVIQTDINVLEETTQVKDHPIATILQNNTTVVMKIIQPATTPIPVAEDATHPTTTPDVSFTTIPTTKEVVGIRALKVFVFGGNNKVIQLPQDSVEITAQVQGQPVKSFEYEWKLIANPTDFDGMQSGKQDSTLKLSSLTAGKYRFKVEVTDQNGYGEALVNVTVLEVLRVNQPPVAVISPNTVNQVLTLPNDATVLDGSGSHDDDGIISYHWKLLQGPLQKDDAKDENILQDGQILKLENLIVGSYTYKLTVTDTDGLTNSTLAHVLVNKGIDNKPIANAGVQQLITLPQDSAVLCGNQSRDDWGIVSYEWSLSPDSVNQVVDLQGARSDCLHVSKLVVGEYKFQLVVTDKAKQTDTATVSVIVHPESNHRPSADAGEPQQLISPLNDHSAYMWLNGSKSSDDKEITSSEWVQISGPHSTIHSPRNLVSRVNDITAAGLYEYKLTVYDAEKASDTATVIVTVKEEQPPRVDVGADTVRITLPDNAVVLDGRKSVDDYGITSFTWLPGLQNPAAGHILNNSDHSAVLQVADLVEGTYTFTLTVVNIRGRQASKSVKVVVSPNPISKSLVELHIAGPAEKLKITQLNQVLNQLAFYLGLTDEDKILVQSVYPMHSTGHAVVLFAVRIADKSYLPAINVVDTLNLKLTSNLLPDVKVVLVDTYVCENKCSNHGKCHSGSKQCQCDPFWMEDFFRAYMGDGKKNCDWSILYVIIVVFIIIIGVCLLLYFITCYCVRRRKHVRYSKKKNYVLVENGKIDKHSKSNGYKRKNGFKRTSENFKTTALMRSMTSTSSDEDQAVFEKRKLINRPKGGGRLKRLKAQKPQPHKTLIDLKDQVSGAEISGDSFDGMGLDENSAILLNSTAKNIHNNDIL